MDNTKLPAYPKEDSKRLYCVWYHMKLRCQNPKVKQYRFYGARGIFVCNLWSDSSEEFRKWAFANGYQRGLQLDRIDNDGPYAPWNCRWVTHAENCLNKRENPTTVRIFYSGKYYTIREASKEFGISIPTIHARRQADWPDDQLFTPPLKKGGLMIKGQKSGKLASQKNQIKH